MGHVPIELSRLKLAWLVVPGIYVARSEFGKMAKVLCDKLQEMKEKYSHFLMTFPKKPWSKL